MRSPLKSWKHWLVWVGLASVVTVIAILFSKAVEVDISPFVLFLLWTSWFVSISAFDSLMHFFKWQ
jgi:hypothetical protein